VVEKETPEDAKYYTVPCPWLQVKLMRLMQYYPPPEDPSHLARIISILEVIIGSAKEVYKNPQQNNAMNAVRFEAINLAIHLDPDSSLVEKATTIMGDHLSSKETNLRYLSLETLAHLASVKETIWDIKRYQYIIIDALRDKDISVRRQSLDLLYSMCDITNVKLIVSELLNYLPQAEFVFREDLVLKIAILSEKFAQESSWYVDVILQLITTAGDQVSNEVWYRIVQIVMSREDLHVYAIRAILVHLKNLNCHEMLVKVGGYLLGEYGHLIANDLGASPAEQFQALHSKFKLCSVPTRSLLLSTYIKFVNLFPEIKAIVMSVFEQYQNALDSELQQRACEYLAICRLPNDDLLQTLCEEMPQFDNNRESILVSRLNKKIADTEDKRTWTVGDRESNKGSRKTSGASPQKSSFSSLTSSPVKPIEEDLLGLGDFASPQAPASNVSSPRQMEPDESQVPETSLKWFYRLFYVNDGILFEDDVIQIGMKTSYSGENGRLMLYYGNKTQVNFTNVQQKLFPLILTESMTVDYPDPKLPGTIQKTSQVPQSLSLVLNKPNINSGNSVIYYKLMFEAGERQMSYTLRFPVVINKFMDAITTFSAEDFFSRWKQVGTGGKEAKDVVYWNTVSAEKRWTAASLRTLLTGLKWGILDSVDPNASNFVASGVINTAQSGKIGALLRLEPNYEQCVSF
jgi:AP-2 complex subunit alpha